MFEAAFPIDLRANLNVVLNSIPNKTFNDVHFITSDSAIFYMLDDFTIEIPYRMYLVDVEEDTYNVLNDIQKQIAVADLTDEQIQELVATLQTRRSARHILNKPMTLSPYWLIR